jgi:hypothetical protein
VYKRLALVKGIRDEQAVLLRQLNKNQGKNREIHGFSMRKKKEERKKHGKRKRLKKKKVL